MIRRALPDDIPAICGLLSTVDPDHPKGDVEVLRWQYWDVPFGRSASVVAEHPRDGIVGHAGLFAVPCRLDGRRVVVGHGADAAVAPSHRRRGLFSALAEARLAAAGELGYPTLLAWPNPRSRHVDRTAGAASEIRVAVYVAPKVWPSRVVWPFRVRPSRAFSGGGRHRHRPTPVTECAAPPRGLADLAAVTTGAAHAIIRDDSWWRWRYAQRPHSAYRYFAASRSDRLVAAAVTTVQRVGGRRVTAVMELLAADVAAARSTLAAVRRSMPTAALAVLAVPGTSAAAVTRACGLLPLPRALEPFPLVLSIAARPDPVRGARAAAADWYVSWGDHDHL